MAAVADVLFFAALGALRRHDAMREIRNKTAGNVSTKLLRA